MIEISIATMKLSDDREEYYTRIICDGRIFEVCRYGKEHRNRAEYEAAELRHVLLGEEKPDIADPKYADGQIIKFPDEEECPECDEGSLGSGGPGGGVKCRNSECNYWFCF